MSEDFKLGLFAVLLIVAGAAINWIAILLFEVGSLLHIASTAASALLVGCFWGMGRAKIMADTDRKSGG